MFKANMLKCRAEEKNCQELTENGNCSRLTGADDFLRDNTSSGSVAQSSGEEFSEVDTKLNMPSNGSSVRSYHVECSEVVASSQRDDYQYRFEQPLANIDMVNNGSAVRHDLEELQEMDTRRLHTTEKSAVADVLTYESAVNRLGEEVEENVTSQDIPTHESTVSRVDEEHEDKVTSQNVPSHNYSVINNGEGLAESVPSHKSTANKYIENRGMPRMFSDFTKKYNLAEIFVCRSVPQRNSGVFMRYRKYAALAVLATTSININNDAGRLLRQVNVNTFVPTDESTIITCKRNEDFSSQRRKSLMEDLENLLNNTEKDSCSVYGYTEFLRCALNAEQKILPKNKDEFVDVILPLKHIIERLEAVGSLEEEDKLIFFEIEQSYDDDSSRKRLGMTLSSPSALVSEYSGLGITKQTGDENRLSSFIKPVRNSSEECCICLEPMKFYETLRRLPCDHELHWDCCCDLLCRTVKCPICFVEVEQDCGQWKRTICIVRSPPITFSVLQELPKHLEDTVDEYYKLSSVVLREAASKP